MTLRKNLAALLLALSIVMAGYISIPARNTRLSPVAPTPESDHLLVSLIAVLSHIEVVHIVGHVLLFGGVAFLVGPWEGGSRALAWRYVLVGGLLMEAVQILIGGSDNTITELVGSTGFDLLVNGIGGVLGIRLAARFQAASMMAKSSIIKP